MGEVDPLVTTLMRAVVIYGAVLLYAGSAFEFYRRETKSGLILLAMSLLLTATLLAMAL